jgi:Domain of unknown function (DUF4349)
MAAQTIERRSTHICYLGIINSFQQPGTPPMIPRSSFSSRRLERSIRSAVFFGMSMISILLHGGCAADMPPSSNEQHLSDSTGKLEDILAVERELSRVRGEVEQMQGRLRFLANRTELSTITIEATEWKDYKPPVAATFPTQLARTFFGSVENLSAFGKTILMVAVALAPWLPLILLGLFAARWLIRLNQKSVRTNSLPRTPPRPTTT